MASPTVERHQILKDEHVVQVRQIVRHWAVKLGFSLIKQTKLVTAVSELARNTFVHGHGGEMQLEAINEPTRTGLQLRFVDSGPGIADVDLAMSDGYSSANGMGMGLPGTRRLVNEFSIDSTPGKGTRVSITMWK